MTDTFTSFFLLAADKPAGPGSIFGNGLMPFVLMIAMFYLLFIRPQQKQRKELAARVASMEKGDKAITTGGFHGSVHQISDKDSHLEGGRRQCLPHLRQECHRYRHQTQIREGSGFQG